MKRLKKFGSAVLALLCACCMSVPLTTSAAVLYGDVNGDGAKNATDVVDLVKFSKGMKQGGSINLKNSDVDKNAVIDVNDQKVLQGNLVGLNLLPYSQSWCNIRLR